MQTNRIHAFLALVKKKKKEKGRIGVGVETTVTATALCPFNLCLAISKFYF